MHDTLRLPVVDSLEGILKGKPILALHGYVEHPEIGPSLPDKFSQLVVRAAAALIRKGLVSGVFISADCAEKDQLSVSQKMEHLLRYSLGKGYENFPIAAERSASITIGEIRILRRRIHAGDLRGESTNDVVDLALGEHAQRVNLVLHHNPAQDHDDGKIVLCGAQEIIERFGSDEDKDFLAQFPREAFVTFEQREQKYRRVYTVLGKFADPIFILFDRIQGNSKFFASAFHHISSRR